MDDARRESAEPILGLIRSVDWGKLEHAYGPAEDVPAELTAVVVGDEERRREAWWHLWGNIHHQGTVYPATAAALPILRAVALWRDHPERGQAVAFLTEVARAARAGPAPGSSAGVYVRDPKTEGGLGLDATAASALAARLAEAVEEATHDLMRNWAEEDAAIRRFLLLLVAVQPECRRRYQALVETELPVGHRRAWLDYGEWPDSQEAGDRIDALERWAHGGDE